MSAVISDCGRYRYTLERRWRDGQRAVFVMLNPSTADAEQNDPTIRRCIGFAKRWGYGQLAVVNLFAFRATDPRELRQCDDPVGPKNNDYLLDVASEAGIVVAAWGNHGKLYRRGDCVRGMMEQAHIPLSVLRLSGEGQPCHPLYLPADTVPTKWSPHD